MINTEVITCKTKKGLKDHLKKVAKPNVNSWIVKTLPTQKKLLNIIPQGGKIRMQRRMNMPSKHFLKNWKP